MSAAHIAIMIQISTHRDALWADKFDQLQTHLSEHGALPTSKGSHSSLNNWLRNQRAAIKRGAYRQDRLAALKAIPGALPSGPSRIDELKTFQATMGRLPLSTATDPDEFNLAQYLIQGLRPSIRRGTVRASTLAIAETIPGATTIRVVPSQTGQLEELTDYVESHGHLPPLGGRGTDQENRLSAWMRNNTRGEVTSKSPRLRARHEAIDALMSKTPGKNAVTHVSNIAKIEKFVADHGYRPTAHIGATDEELELAGWYRHSNKLKLDDFSLRRLEAVDKQQTFADVHWKKTFGRLEDYARNHKGRMPAAGVNGQLYYWLISQRSIHDRGTMSAWRVEILGSLPGVLPAAAYPVSLAA